jgi:preprotein translocase subunit SecD
MRKVILLGWMLSFFGFAASAYAEFSMNAVADQNVATNTQKYDKYQATLNKFEPKTTIWVQKEARLTEEDVDAAYVDSIKAVENAFSVPLKVINRQPAVKIKFKNSSRQKLEKFTSENVNKIVAIVLDGKILAAPKEYEPITDGIILINGNWTAEEVAHIVNRINEIIKAKNKNITRPRHPGTRPEIK